MSTIPGNPYAEKYSASSGLSAEVVSSLIVAHEHRTIALIAYLEYAEGDEYEAVHRQVAQCLGLRADS